MVRCDLGDGSEYFGLIEEIFTAAIVLLLIGVSGVAAAMEFQVEFVVPDWK